MTTRDEIVAEARSWVGVKFKKGGRDRMGVDCIGLLVNVGKKFGFDIQDSTEYSFNPEPAKFQDLVYTQTKERKLDDIDVGMLLLFRQSIFPMHTGILARDRTGRFSVINASVKERRVVEEPMEQWEPLIIGLRDYREMA